MSTDFPNQGEMPRRRVPLEHVTDWETLIVEARYSPKALCARCGFSMRHVQRFIVNRYQMTLREFVSALRMTKAYNLLRSGFSIKETSIGLGFKQVSHFCRCFKQHFQAKPSSVILNVGTGPDGNPNEPQMELDFFHAAPRRRRSGSKPQTKENARDRV